MKMVVALAHRVLGGSEQHRVAGSSPLADLPGGEDSHLGLCPGSWGWWFFMPGAQPGSADAPEGFTNTKLSKFLPSIWGGLPGT